MKKIVAIITFSIGLILSGFANAAAFHDLADDNFYDELFFCQERYTNQNYSFSVECPNNWVFSENPTLPPIIDDKLVTMSPTTGAYNYGTTFVVISVGEGFADLLSDEDLILRFLELDHRHNFKKTWAKPIKVGNLDAHQIKFTWMDFQTGRMNVYSTLFFLGEDVITVSSYSVEEYYQDYFPFFKNIVNSISVSGTLESAENYPNWFSDVTTWWSQGLISGLEYRNAILFLEKEGIIK